MLPIVYFASDPIAIPVLQWLGNCPDIERLLVVTSPDARSGRGRKVRPNAVKTAALELGLEVQQPVKPDSQWTAGLRREGFRTGFVFAYGHILKPELLDCFAGYLLNFHGSILPRYRGASPVETAIAEGDDETGVSLMQVIRRMDAGPVAAVERVPIRPTTTGPELRMELSRAAVRCLDREWNGIRDRRLNFVEQDERAATYVRCLRKEDGALDFRQPAAELERRIRAFAGWPGSWFEWIPSGRESVRIKVGSAIAEPSPVGGVIPGTVIGSGSDGLRVATGDGVLLFRDLQRPGGRMLPAGAFLRGCPLNEGQHLEIHDVEPLLRRNPVRSAGRTDP